MIKVLVTGGCGFIGSAIVNFLLKNNYQVYIIDNLSLGKDYWKNSNQSPTIFINDILDYNSCDKIFNNTRPEIVIHLAAHHFIPFCEKNIYDAYNLNVTGTMNILELSRKYFVEKFFIASTGDVYAPSFSPHFEVDMISPIYIYGHTKYLAEQLCIKYYETKMQKSSFIIGRLFNAAGPRETNPHFLPEVTKQIIEGKRRIEVGNLWPKRDFVDVESMADLIINLTINATGIEIVNIGSGIAQEVGEALNTLISILPFKVEIASIRERQRPNDRPYLCPDIAKLKRMVGRAAKPFNEETAKEIFREKNYLNV